MVKLKKKKNLHCPNAKHFIFRLFNLFQLSAFSQLKHILKVPQTQATIHMPQDCTLIPELLPENCESIILRPPFPFALTYKKDKIHS